ncbi:MAG: cytochrome c [Acidimicrobiaceae bacterium]|jgi:cytochrome c1|nr:cytochrome c [Acidimicrobiaceae bacterium]
MRTRISIIVGALTIALGIAGCSGHGRSSTKIVSGGSAEHGSRLIVRYGCGSCHTIPGVKGASALVGPPLIHWSRRSFIAGRLANTPDNLIRWISDPQGVEPGVDMPNLGVTQDDARDIAAYLEGIR